MMESFEFEVQSEVERDMEREREMWLGVRCVCDGICGERVGVDGCSDGESGGAVEGVLRWERVDFFGNVVNLEAPVTLSTSQRYQCKVHIGYLQYRWQ